MPRRLLLALACLAIAASMLAQPVKRKITVEDFAAFKDVRNARISPDGQSIVYTVRQRDLKKDENRTHVWLASYDGSRSRQLTFSESSETSPEWSPDGRQIAFLSSRASEDDPAQLWVMPADGGEAEQITKLDGDVSDFDWAPDGKRLVLVVADPDPDKLAEKNAKEDEKTTARPIVIDRFQFKIDEEGYLTDQREHLHLLDLATRKTEQLTKGKFDEMLPSYSPDGKLIAFVTKRGEDPDRSDNTDIYVIEPKAGAEPRQVTTFAGSDVDPESDTRPAWSPDASQLVYVQGGAPELIYYAVRHLAIVPVAGGSSRLLAATLDRNPSNPRFSADGKKIWFLLEEDRTQSLARIAATGGTIEKVAGGKRVISDYDVANDRAVVVAEETTQPAELFAVSPQLKQITRHNTDLVTQLALAKSEEISFNSKDGTEIHGFVVIPADAVAGKSYPAILRIHGGPVGQFDHSFDFEWQLFAANGYVVVAANPRGSSGRGQEFSRAIWADWGNRDAQDVLAAVDAVVARGLADPKRLGLGGWSYGGMLTNYVIAQDKRFKAAASGASMSNAFAGYGTDQYIREYEAELGKPWEHPDLYTRVSFPFLHADRIVTPTLFLVGEQDFNVPALNSEQMYQALRSLGVPTQLIIYPEQHHGISKPTYIKDRYERYLAWYGKYLK